MPTKTGSARYEGFGKDGRGHVSTESGALTDQYYGFNTRFEGAKGTNPEELIAAAHASCFTMATSFALARAGYSDGTLDTKCAVTLDKDGDGFKISKSELTMTATISGIDEAEFFRIADEAKAGCPVSKVLNCEITLERSLSA
jgi:osmotically inducible protein OsmC